MTESVAGQPDGRGHAKISPWQLLSILGNGPGILGDIGGLAVPAAEGIRRTSTWTHVVTSRDPEVVNTAHRAGLRFVHERQPWDLPFGINFMKAAMLKVPDTAVMPRVIQSFDQLRRTLQPGGVALVSTDWGGLQQEQLAKLLTRSQLEVQSVIQLRSGSVSEVYNTDDPIMAVVRSRWRPWRS